MSGAKMEEYEKMKKHLHEKLMEKKNIDKQLVSLEEEIYAKETLYLTNSFASNSTGNIIKGLESFARSSTHHSSHGAYGGLRRRNSFTDDDRIFSLSSAIYVKHLQKKNKNLDNDEAEEDEDEEEVTNGRKRKKD